MSSIKTNTAELLKFTFGIMQSLRGGLLQVEEAKAHANLVKQANNTLKYELDRAIALEKHKSLELRDIEEL